MVPRLVLLGSGPSHLLLLESLSRQQEPARETVMVAPTATEMSPGTLPGLLAGRYRPSEIGINLPRLAQAAGARFIQSTVRSIDPASRTVRLEDGETLLYNAASIAEGPYPASSSVPGASLHARYLHTLDQAIELVPHLEGLIREVPEQTVRIIVTGGGPEALEVALSLRQVLDRAAGGRGVVTMIGAAHAVWRERGTSARLADAALKRNDITAILGAEISEVESQRLRLSNGARVPFDILIWAAADQAAGYLTRSGLQLDHDGNGIVDEHLQALDAPGLFLAGEVSIRNDGQPRRVGIEPLEGARVIGENLLAVLAGKPPSRTYRSSRSRLTLAETGGESVLLSFGSLGLEGRWLMRFKERADRRLMQRLSALSSGQSR